ncbi:MAG TPA: thioesterase family protein [Isosphaeraceae bacterium]|nr:thioesterase family protein [Isosphaeraceae bacterium]
MDALNTVESLLAGFPVVVTVPVQWGDQDAFGHVNNTVYFRWMESARIAYGQRIGLHDLLADRQIGPILASTACDFRRPVNFPDTIHVGIRINRIGRTSLAHDMRIVSQEQQAVVAEGTSTTVVFDYAANRPHPVPAPIRQAIEALEGRSF